MLRHSTHPRAEAKRGVVGGSVYQAERWAGAGAPPRGRGLTRPLRRESSIEEALEHVTLISRRLWVLFPDQGIRRAGIERLEILFRQWSKNDRLCGERRLELHAGHITVEVSALRSGVHVSPKRLWRPPFGLRS